MEVDHRKMSVADSIYLIGQLEHMRLHCITAAANAPEEEVIGLLVLAKRCQEERRKFMLMHFPNLPERYWCIVKVSGTLYQLLEELSGVNTEEIKGIKSIIDEAVLLATGDDISGCEACKKDAEDIK